MADDLRKLAEAAKAIQTVMKLPPDHYEDRSIREFRRAATPDAILDLYRERDEARAEVARLSDGFTAATANRDEAVRRRAAAEASLASAQEEVARLLSAMMREEDYLLRMIEAEDETGGLMIGDVQGAFHRIRDKDSDDLERADEAATLTQETPNER